MAHHIIEQLVSPPFLSLHPEHMYCRDNTRTATRVSSCGKKICVCGGAGGAHSDDTRPSLRGTQVTSIFSQETQ